VFVSSSGDCGDIPERQIGEEESTSSNAIEQSRLCGTTSSTPVAARGSDRGALLGEATMRTAGESTIRLTRTTTIAADGMTILHLVGPRPNSNPQPLAAAAR
jgi:hypothetical protein